MGFQALEANGITAKLLFLLRDARLTPTDHPLFNNKGSGIRRGAVWGFVAVELVGFGATFAITQTVAAVGFPVFILALIPVRAVVLPRWLSAEELGVLDAPTASDFTMESCGGSFGGSGGSDGDGDGGGGFLEGQGAQSSTEMEEGAEETEREGGGKKDGCGAGGAALGRRTGGGLSEEELAELGESRSGGVRRRLSVLNREETA
jgi:hypothetical protein